MKINEIKKALKTIYEYPPPPFWPINNGRIFLDVLLWYLIVLTKLHLVCLLIVIFLFKSCGFWIWFLLSFILRIIKKEQHISEYKSTSISSMGLKGPADICKKNNLSRKSNPLLYSKSPICIIIINLHYLNSINRAIDLSTVCRLTSRGKTQHFKNKMQRYTSMT